MNQVTQWPEVVRALTFDVFGTVVDWRSSVIREGQILTTTKGFRVDWAKFADTWRAGYRPAMDRVRKGELAWTSIDALHRLIAVCIDFSDLLQSHLCHDRVPLLFHPSSQHAGGDVSLEDKREDNDRKRNDRRIGRRVEDPTAI